jgi:hypothetical protein
MYICALCQRQIGPGVPCQRVVLAIRATSYRPRPERNDPGGSGWEIAQDVPSCPECASRHVPPAPPDRAAGPDLDGEIPRRTRRPTTHLPPVGVATHSG